MSDQPAILHHLNKVLSSSEFSSSLRLQQLLKYLVTETLQGNADRLKGFTLAVEVFGRDANFDTNNDAIVRVQIGKLRKKLQHYYLTQGNQDAIRIELKPGSYVPRFTDQKTHQDDKVESSQQSLHSTIAVAPFENLSTVEFDYLCSGFSDEIVTMLTRDTHLKVLNRQATQQLLDPMGDLTLLKRQSGVDYLLNGQVQVAGGRFRINVQLTDTATSQHLWAETFTGNLTTEDLFEIQETLAEKAVARMALSYGAIKRFETRQALRKPPQSLNHYEWVLRAYDYVEHPDENKHEAVRQGLIDTIQGAPDYAEAWAMLAWVYADEYRFNYNVSAEYDSLEKALFAANRSVSLDPQNSIAHQQLATTYYARKELDAFFAATDKALLLNNRDTYLLADLGTHLCFAGEWSKGLPLVDIACENNPIHPNWYHFPRLVDDYLHKRYTEALVRALTSHNTGYFWSSFFLTLIYSALSRQAEAEKAKRELDTLYPNFAQQVEVELDKWFLESSIRDKFLQDWRKLNV